MDSLQQQWDRLRREARQLETELDGRLAAYGRSTAPTTTTSSTNAAAAPSLAEEMELERLLEGLGRVVDQLAQTLEQQYPATSSTMNPSMMHILQRHRDVLYDYGKEFKRAKANQKAAREHAQLLGSVRDDISQYRNQQMAQKSAEERMLMEREKLGGIHRMTDEVLEAGYASYENVQRQGSRMASLQRRITDLGYRFPGLNSLITKIQNRKRRDALIMGVVIGVCCFLLLLYVLPK